MWDMEARLDEEKKQHSITFKAMTENKANSILNPEL